MAGTGHVAVQGVHAAGLHRPGAGQQCQEAGLPHAVRAEQSDHAPGREVEGDVRQGLGLAVAQADAHEARHGGLRVPPRIIANCW